MLSVCIPVFNYDARPLVKELLLQAWRLESDVELLVYDDGSDPKFQQLNREIGDNAAVRYREMPQNLGRGPIRNRMAREALGDYLIMLDVDSWPNPTYLSNYLAKLALRRSGRRWNHLRRRTSRRSGPLFALALRATAGSVYSCAPPQSIFSKQ